MYMAPPSMKPLWSRTRYFTAAYVSAYFVAMPNRPVTHIHKTAPGPPARMAVATPTMEPVPMVAASAVASAPKWLMSPLPSGSLESDSLMAFGSLRWMKPVLKVKNRCDPRRSAIIAGPQTRESMVSRSSSIAIGHCSARKRRAAKARSDCGAAPQPERPDTPVSKASDRPEGARGLRPPREDRGRPYEPGRIRPHVCLADSTAPSLIAVALRAMAERMSSSTPLRLSRESASP